MLSQPTQHASAPGQTAQRAPAHPLPGWRRPPQGSARPWHTHPNTPPAVHAPPCSHRTWPNSSKGTILSSSRLALNSTGNQKSRSCSGMASVELRPLSRPPRRRRCCARCTCGAGSAAGPACGVAACAAAAAAAAPAASQLAAASCPSPPKAARTLPSRSVRFCTLSRNRSSDRWICREGGGGRGGERTGRCASLARGCHARTYERAPPQPSTCACQRAPICAALPTL